MLLYDRNIIGASSEIVENLRKSSVIFGKSPKNVRKRSSYFRNNFGKSSQIFGKWSEIFGKSSKTSSLVCLCNKQNITCPLVDMNFIFSCSTRHLTRSLRSLVRYRVEHSKIKFISTRGHVTSSIYFPRNIISLMLALLPWKSKTDKEYFLPEEAVVLKQGGGRGAKKCKDHMLNNNYFWFWNISYQKRQLHYQDVDDETLKNTKITLL